MDEVTHALAAIDIESEVRWRVTEAGYAMTDPISRTDVQEENLTLFLELCAYRDEEPHTQKMFAKIFTNYAVELVHPPESAFVTTTRDRLPQWLDEMTRHGLLERVTQ